MNQQLKIALLIGVLLVLVGIFAGIGLLALLWRPEAAVGAPLVLVPGKVAADALAAAVTRQTHAGELAEPTPVPDVEPGDSLEDARARAKALHDRVNARREG